MKTSFQSRLPLFLILFSAFLVAFLGCSATSFGQKKWEKAYASRLDSGSQMFKAGPIWMIEKTCDKRFLYKEFFFETGVLTKRAELLDEKSLEYHGKWASWDDDGKRIDEGTFDQGIAVGVWKIFNAKTSRVSELGKKIGHKKVGTWRFFHADGWLERMVAHDSEGQLHGESIFYDEKGQPTRRDFYENGKFVRSDDSTAVTPFWVDELLAEEMPKYPGGEEALLKHFAKNILYPRDAREIGIMGRGMVEFVVENDGSITEIRVINGLSKSIRDECLRVVGSLKKWEPGLQNGRPFRVKMHIPIVFKLD